MKRPTRDQRTMTLYAALVAGLMLIASCGGGGGGGGGATTSTLTNAPVVTNFRIVALTAEKANTANRYQITATVTDPNNDLLGGQVEVNDGTKTLTIAISAGTLQGNTVGVILFTNPVPAGTYQLTFTVVDAAGNRSNVITFSLTITPEAAHPSGNDGILQQLLPAR